MSAMAGFLAIAEPALIGVGVIALPIGANALLSYLRLARFLPIIRKAFTVIDPLLNEHLSGYSASDARFAMELVTGVLADGQLSRAEVERVVAEIERRYRPSQAAGKTAVNLKMRLGPDSAEAKLLDAVVDIAQKRELLPSNLLDAAKVIRMKIS
jgi:hypothetical protein